MARHMGQADPHTLLVRSADEGIFSMSYQHASTKGRLRFAAIAFTAFALLMTASGTAQAAAVTVPLGTANSFVVLAGTGITNTGATTLNGDMGSFPTATVTNTGTITVNGVDHGGDGVTQSAQTDLTAAYLNAAGQGPVDGTISADLGGQTLTPGVYAQATTMNLSGPVPLTLDGLGDPNAVWIFQAGADLIVGSASSVALVNGAQSCNIYWQVTSSATIGTTAAFRGTILALTSITLDTGATIVGRALARNGTVTMDSNTITRPVCATSAGGGISTGDGSTAAQVDLGRGTLVFTAAAGVVLGAAVVGVVAIRRRRDVIA